jgi:periplasmic divalent cation tolerance protein
VTTAMKELQDAQGAMVALTTVGSAEAAQKLVETLVTERLLACGNVVGPIQSTYVWKGALSRDAEFLIVMKTRRELLEPLLARMRQLHPYEVPEFLALPVEAGFAGYLAWLRENTRKEA